MTDPDLMRFVEAQDPVFDRALAELASGRKSSHWMWFIFPQVAGLGFSPTAQFYAIADLDQARRYLAAATLGARLRACTHAMLAVQNKSARGILGTPDDLKFRSCMTLFGRAATDPADTALFQSALNRFYDGKPDDRTLALLGQS